MNLEEELEMNNILTGDTIQVEPMVQNTTVSPVSISAELDLGNQVAPQQYVQPMYNQPAMVNVNAASAQVGGFNFSRMELDVTKPIERNPISRLSGENGQKFRLHLLPGAKTYSVEIHNDKKRERSFVCLCSSYGLETAPCCNTHGKAKKRYILPVVVYQTQGSDVIPGAPAQLKVLIVNDKDYEIIQNSAKESANKTIDKVDIIATVDKPQFKTFTYITSMQENIASVSNVPALLNVWNQYGTQQNCAKLCASLISAEEYESTYSDYNYKDYFTNNNGVEANKQAYPQYQQQYPQQGFNGGYQQPVQQGYGYAPTEPQQYQQPVVDIYQGGQNW